MNVELECQRNFTSYKKYSEWVQMSELSAYKRCISGGSSIEKYTLEFFEKQEIPVPEQSLTMLQRYRSKMHQVHQETQEIYRRQAFEIIKDPEEFEVFDQKMDKIATILHFELRSLLTRF